jgi:glycine oxidase
VNIIVIGAGIVGCAVAYALASRGARVRVIERRQVGQGATRASAGVLCPHIEGHSASLLHLGVRSLSLYDAFVDGVRSDSGLAVEYRRDGTLEVALTDEEAGRLREAAGHHAARGVDHRYLDAAEARDAEPAIATEVTAALLVPSHGYVGVTALTRALAAAAAARGTESIAADVKRVDGTGRGVRVVAGGTTYDADVAVIAAGSWSGVLTVGEKPRAPVRPVRGQLLHLAGSAAPAVKHVIWGRACYIVPWQDESLLVGATSEDVGFDERATVAGVRDLLEAACDLLPGAWQAQFREVRVGLRPATPDELPIIGRSSTTPAIVYATGHYRNGVLLAPLTAALVADLVLDGRAGPELAITSPARFGL